MIKKLAKYVGEYKKQAILCPIFMIGEVVMEMLIPLIMATIVDDGIEVGNIKVVTICGILMVCAALISLFFGAMAARMSAVASCGFSKNLRRGMYTNIQDFAFENIDKFSTASLVTRLTTDVNMVQMSFQTIIRMCFRAPIQFITALIMAITISPRLSLILSIAIPILVVGLALIMSKAMPYFKQMFKKIDKLNSVVQENLIGIRVVKAFVREEHEKEKFDQAAEDVKAYSTRAQKITILNNPLMQFVMYAVMIAICWIGGNMVIEQTEVFGQVLSKGDLLSFITYCMQLLMSLMMVSMVFVMITMSRTSAQRICEVLDERTNLSNNDNPITEVVDGSIDFENVSFSYSNDLSNPTIEDINIHINSGDTVGIIGGTGSGKTTLVQLIPRLYDVSSGSLKVGGIDVRDYDIESLRNKVAMVLQKNVLFSGSIIENLKWGNESATMEEIIDACKKSQAHDFIESFPDKYETDLGQGGVNVSGGQKQRLCIARALLKKPNIIILDDSTSAVDTKTDALIRQSFKDSLPNVTKIIIAQRIASVEDADMIIVLDNGKVSAYGKHDELMKSSEIYKEVYESQKKGAEDE